MVKKIFVFILTIILFHVDVSAKNKIRNHFFKQRSFEKYLYTTMPEFKALLDSPTVYRTQIYFSKIKRNRNGKVHFNNYEFKKYNLYYYPASCVKLPVIVGALVKLNERSVPLQSKLIVNDSSYCGFMGQSEIKNGWRIDEYIKRMLVVSNNICFNPIYDFANPNYINKMFNSNIQQRFNYACVKELNKYLYNLEIFDSTVKLYRGEFKINRFKNFDSSWALAGLRYLDVKDSLINQPKSFANANYINLKNLQLLVKNITANKFFMIDEDRNFLLKYMSIYPSECKHPAYDAKEYPDNWGKYLLIGDDTNFHKNIPIQQLPTLSIGEGKGEVIKEKLLNWNDDSIRIFNKVGMAYGFLTDCAYIVDYKNQVEFIVSASVFVDRDGTLNDGKYAYKEIGLPFLGKLGRVLMQHELHHKRKSKFAAPKLEYTD